MSAKPKKKLGLLAKLALTSGSLMASLLVCELMVRLFIEVPVIPFLREYDPDTGTQYKKNLSAVLKYPEFTMKWSTNSRGFRGPEPPPSSEGCVLILGDSYSEGWGVSDDEVYASVLRDKLDAEHGESVVPVINASMSATGNGRWLKLMRGELADYSPRLVVLQVCWNDTSDNMREKLYRFGRYRPRATAEGAVSEVLENIDPKMPFIRQLQPLLEAVPGVEGSHLFALIRDVIRNQARLDWDLDKDAPDERIRREERLPHAIGRAWLSRGDRLFLALVEQSLALCRARGWPVALISVRIGDTRFDEIQRMCERLGATLIDIRNREARPDLYYEVDSHWNPAGHRFMADLIYDRFLR